MLSTDSGIWLSGDSVMLGNQYLVSVSFGNFFLPIISLLLLKQLFVGHWTDNELHTKKRLSRWLLLHQTGQFQFQFSYLQDFFLFFTYMRILVPLNKKIQMLHFNSRTPPSPGNFSIQCMVLLWIGSSLQPPCTIQLSFKKIGLDSRPVWIWEVRVPCKKNKTFLLEKWSKRKYEQ